MIRMLSSGIATTINAIAGDDVCRVDMAAGLFGPTGYRLALGYASFGKFDGLNLTRFGDSSLSQFGGWSLIHGIDRSIRRSRSHWFDHQGRFLRQHFVTLH
ncbi:MAG: hypothetical protein HC929_18860 [Leptolyngbyaceae cyanobacterium SM2_5_2]|nr:hypothetical protein [Leptolyngbyaceae cyanobacterium SM2_5_2]